MTPPVPPKKNAWHPGETSLQQKLGFTDSIRDQWNLIKDRMTEQHRVFHTSNLQFLPVTVLDGRGRPWGSILAGGDGGRGFVTSPDDTTLIVDAVVWSGDPFLGSPFLGSTTSTRSSSSVVGGVLAPVLVPSETFFLTAGIGVEHSTRRRNKFAGWVRDVVPGSLLSPTSSSLEGSLDGSSGSSSSGSSGSSAAGDTGKFGFRLVLEVNQALGNCPKYINMRKLIPHPNTHPSIVYQNLDMTDSDKIPDEIVKFITEADTAFLATIFKSDSSSKTTTKTTTTQPSQAGMNIRAGLPGFIRVKTLPKSRTKLTLVLPDYSGNRHMSSLGNITSTPLAGLTIVDFGTGNILYLTGSARVLSGAPATEIMARQACLTLIEVTGYTFVRDALPVRQDSAMDVERSPYSPRVKYLLCDEREGEGEGLLAVSSARNSGPGLRARLTHATQFTHDIAILRFEIIGSPGRSGGFLKIRPGQAVVLDFMDWMGPPVYKHMANDAPGSINDDRLRTWTMSSAHVDGDKADAGADVGAAWFELTMRKVKNGAVTGALFRAISGYTCNNWEKAVQIDDNNNNDNTKDTNVIANIVGVDGTFYLETETETESKSKTNGLDLRMLWVAGGIGLTPFMAMLTAITSTSTSTTRATRADIVLALAVREPEVFLKLIKRSLSTRAWSNVQVRIDIFTTGSRGSSSGGSDGGTSSSDQTDFQTYGLQQMNVNIVTHKGRIPMEYWSTVSDARDVFICGPGGFGDAAERGLRGVGVPEDKIHREGFY